MILPNQSDLQVQKGFFVSVGIHPDDFRIAWDLSYKEVALLLGLSEQTLRTYGFSTKAKKSRNPSVTVKALAASISYIWIRDGWKPIRPDLLSAELLGQ